MVVDEQSLIDYECTLLLARDKGVGKRTRETRTTRYFSLFPCPPSIVRACVLFSEYRAWVCVVLRVSRVGVFSPSCARGFVLSSEYRACAQVHFARSLVFRRK